MGTYRKYIQIICNILEIIAAGLVLIGILLSVFSIVSDIDIFRNLVTDVDAFKHYLEQIFTLIIGVEFLGMLCRPDSENVLEVLIFLVARHMIVGDTTSLEDFVSVISICLLCVLRRYLRETKKSKKKENEDAESAV